jgi:hypothetical protein
LAIRKVPETEDGGEGGIESKPEAPAGAFSVVADAALASGPGETGPAVAAASATNAEKLRTRVATSVTIEASGISAQ